MIGVDRCAACGAELPPSPSKLRRGALARMGVFLPAARGEHRRFCNSACKMRAFRRRQAGLAEDAFPDGAHRGRVPLGDLTRAEQRRRWEQVADELRAAKEELAS
jgi:hypothetical protein